MGFKKAITSTYLWEVVSPPWKWVKRKKQLICEKLRLPGCSEQTEKIIKKYSTAESASLQIWVIWLRPIAFGNGFQKITRITRSLSAKRRLLWTTAAA